MVPGKSMLTCPKCHAGIPEGMRFCLQCGASVAPYLCLAAPPPPVPGTAPRQPPRRAAPTIPLKIAATSVMASRVGAATQHPRPSLGNLRVEVDDETLKESFARPVAQTGAVVCRFCRGPLDLAGDFCDQCGAPVAEAAPAGTLKPDPPPTAPEVPPPATDTLPPSTPADSSAASASAQHPGVAASAPAMPAALMEPVDPAPTPGPGAPTSSSTPPAEEHPRGFVSRLKGLFEKKG